MLAIEGPLAHVPADVLEELALPLLRALPALQLALTPRVAEQHVPQRVIVEVADGQRQLALYVLLCVHLRCERRPSTSSLRRAGL